MLMHVHTNTQNAYVLTTKHTACLWQRAVATDQIDTHANLARARSGANVWCTGKLLSQMNDLLSGP